MGKLSVVLLNWNDYLGRGAQYVDRMRAMINRHLSEPHEIVVVTEHDVRSAHTGWFCKLDLFEMFDGEVLYLDLDVVISGNIDCLVEYPRQIGRDCIYARDDWSYPVTNPRGGGLEETINSSVMYWRGVRDMSAADALIPETHGDQGILTQLFWAKGGINLYPSEWIKSYKYDYLQGRGYSPICVMHGNPKQHEVLSDPLVAEYWV